MVNTVIVVRAPLLALLIAVCGCAGDIGTRSLSADEGTGGGSGSGSNDGAGLGLAPNCQLDVDCIVAAPKCCDCPTHAVPATDPAQNACLNVDCAPMSCGSPMQAACTDGHCTLECAPVACDANIACPNGFATDANGCLTCECAGAADLGGECVADPDCARVREDCCGCENGGFDTAVPASQAASHDAALNCPTDPTCPGGSTCALDLAARCVQGTCSLVSGPLPVNSCGRTGLPACVGGEACYVNASDQATMHGVGVCQP